MPQSTLFSGGPGSLIITSTPDRVAIYDASTGELKADDLISITELQTLDGVTSNIQAQLDAITNLADGAILIGDASGVAQEIVPTGDVTITNAGVMSITADSIVDADINTAAAVARTKMASTTADRVLINDGSGVMSESAITATELTYLDDATPLTAVALADNQAVAGTIITLGTAATINAATLEYSIERSTGNQETGRVMIASDGTTVAVSQDAAELGTTGVTLTATIDSGNLVVQYTSTSTGTAPSMKYRALKWSN